MSYRIELSFVGEGPEEELERAVILGNAKVRTAVLGLSEALNDVGLTHTVAARAVKTSEARRNGGRRKLAVAAE